MSINEVLMQDAAEATGNGTVLDVTAKAGAAVQVSGTFVGTVTFEVTQDGTNYVSILGENVADGTLSTTTTSTGVFVFPTSGLRGLRARVSAYTSGSITARGGAVDAAPGFPAVTSIIPGTGANNLGKAEDAVHASGDVGVLMLGVRKDTAAALAGADGDYAPPEVDASGNLHVKAAANSGVDIGDVDVTSIIPGVGATNLGKAEDAAHTSGDVGVMMLGVTKATPVALGADGDYAPPELDIAGRLHVVQSKLQPTVAVSTGAAAINTTTVVAAVFRLKAVTVHFSAAPTTSENLIVKLDATAGVAYDTTLYKVDPSVGAVTDIVYMPEGDGLLCASGDEIVVTFTNTDTVTYGLRIVTEAV